MYWNWIQYDKNRYIVQVFRLKIMYLRQMQKVNQFSHLFLQSSLQFCLQSLSFFDIINRPPLNFFVIVRNFNTSVEMVLSSVEEVVTVVEETLDSVLVISVVVISVLVIWVSAVNGKHEVVLKQKFPSMTSVKNPKRVMSVSASRESCCSQFTPINSFWK